MGRRPRAGVRGRPVARLVDGRPGDRLTTPTKPTGDFSWLTTASRSSPRPRPIASARDLTRRRLLSMGAAGLAGLVVAPACSPRAVATTAAAARGGTRRRRDVGRWQRQPQRSTSSRGPSTTTQDLLDSFGNVTVTVYNSNEEAIAEAAGGEGHERVRHGHPDRRLHPADGRRRADAAARQVEAPELRQPRPALPQSDVGPGQQVHGSEGLGHRPAGSTTTPCITTPIKTWQRLHRCGATGPASGQTSRARLRPGPHAASTSGPTASTGRRRGHRRTSTPARTFIVNKLAPHIKAFDSYPGINLTQGNYVLSQVWNGDARQGLLVGRRPRPSTRGALGAPTTELWMDNCVHREGRPEPRLRLRRSSTSSSIPENSVIDLEFHGYNTGAQGHRVPARRPTCRSRT